MTSAVSAPRVNRATAVSTASGSSSTYSISMIARAQAVDLGPDRGLEALARRAPDGLLHHHADPSRDQRRDPDDGLAPDPGDPRGRLDDRGVHDVRCDLHARYEVAAGHDLAVEDREHLERIEPVDALELRDEDVDDAVGGGHEVEAALVRAADVQVRAGDGTGQPQRRVVLVQLAGLDHEDRHGRSGLGGREGEEVLGAQPATLDPALPADLEVAGEDRPVQRRRRASTGSDSLDTHAGTLRVRAVLGATERGIDGATGVHHRHPRSIVAVGVDVAVDRLAVRGVLGRGSHRGRRTVTRQQGVLDRLCAIGHLAHPGQRDPGMRDGPAGRGDDGAHPDDRVPRGGVLQPLVRTPRTGRQGVAAQRGQDLVRGDVARERALEEAIERHDALATPRAQHDLVVERQTKGRQIRGRVGVGDGAPDRAPVADLDVADAEDAVAGEVERCRLEDLGVGGECPELEPTVGRGARAAQLRQPADVDQGAGAGQTQLHQRQDAHPTGDDLGVATGQRGQRVVEGRRPPVLERCGDHAWPPFADWIADQTFWDV